MMENVLPEDFSQLFEIEQAAHLVPWSEGTLRNNQGDKYLNLKWQAQGEILAFAICQQVLDEATLFNIAVHPKAQGKGIGKQLLSGLIAQLRCRDVLTLWLEVRASNQVAIQLYQSLGFNEVTVRKRYYPMPDGGREDAIVMALYL